MKRISFLTRSANNSSAVLECQRSVNAHFSNQAAFWKEIYEVSDVYSVIHQERLAYVFSCIDKLDLAVGSRALDIGCGAGRAAVGMAKRGYIVNAVDTVSAMVAQTQSLAAKEGVTHQVTGSVNDVHNLALPDKTFSLVVAMGVTPWLHSLEKPIREISRVMKPGGWLLINADNRWRLNYLLDPKHCPPLRPAKTAIRGLLERIGLLGAAHPTVAAQMYSTKELDTALSAAGLNKVESRHLGFGPFTLFNCKMLPDHAGIRLHRWLQTATDRDFPLFRSVASQYLVLAQKSFSSLEL